MPRLALALLWLCGARSAGGARDAGAGADNPAFLLPMMLDGVPVCLPHFASSTVAESLEAFFTSHMLDTDEGPPPDAFVENRRRLRTLLRAAVVESARAARLCRRG